MMRGAKTVRSRIGSIVQTMPNGEYFVRRIPKTTLKSYVSGKESDMFVYDGFVPNDSVIGTWIWALWPNPKGPDDIDSATNNWLKPKLGKGPIKVKGSKDTLVIHENGKTSKSGYFKHYFWTGNMLVSNTDGLAVKMFVKTFNGIDFLFVERGNFEPSKDDDGTAKIPADFHPGFTGYMRKQD